MGYSFTRNFTNPFLYEGKDRMGLFISDKVCYLTYLVAYEFSGKI
jgi:hypothetical protein